MLNDSQPTLVQMLNQGLMPYRWLELIVVSRFERRLNTRENSGGYALLRLGSSSVVELLARNAALDSGIGKRQRAGMPRRDGLGSESCRENRALNDQRKFADRVAISPEGLSSAGAAWFRQIFYKRKRLEAKAIARALQLQKGTSAVNRKEKFSIDTPTLAMQNSRRTALSQGRFV